MDFGTICSNIENCAKYENSNDVLRDVQYIWDNCCKYNKKGHYILELMKRVRRNFTKLWAEAGLHMEAQETDGEGSWFFLNLLFDFLPMQNFANVVDS